MFKRVLLAWVVASFISAFSVAHAADLLLDQMVGTWLGEGERIQAISGSHTRIQARTVAVMQAGDQLFSHNEVTETELSTLKSRTYVRDYWVRPNVEQAGRYDLGVGNSVTSQGHFDAGILEVEQNLGGNPPYVVRSRTLFDAQGSLYEENSWSGDRELSQTHIRYRR